MALYIPTSTCFGRTYHWTIKGNLGCQQYQSQIRVFLNLYLHQQLKFDNSLFVIHTKWFVLITEFLAGRYLEMWRSCVAMPDPHSFSCYFFLSRVETGTTTHTRHISRWRPAANVMIKTNRLGWIIYTELSHLSCWCKHKLRKTLIWDRYCWTAVVPFNAYRLIGKYGIVHLRHSATHFWLKVFVLWGFWYILPNVNQSFPGLTRLCVMFCRIRRFWTWAV